MSELFEVCMVVLFGLSWPVSILRSWRARTAKGKSLLFLSLIDIGYICGILSKFIAGTITYVLIFYILNLCLVSADIALYFRNRRLDNQKDAGSN